MADVLAAILAGGESRRMKRAKAVIELAGKPLISYPIAAARAAGLEPIVVAKRGSELPALDCPVLVEDEERSHPLAGVVAVLRDRNRPVLALGCDMPLLSAELLGWLAAQPEALVVPQIGGRLQPLLARYSPGLAGPLAVALEAAEPVHEALRRLGLRLVGEPELEHFGDPDRLAFNVNSPADLQEAERLLATGTTSTSAL